jgi:adenylylsulfate kinase
MVIWVCGLSGAGKTTLCNTLYRLLKDHVPELVLLEGEEVRAAFSNDLGYTEQNRVVLFKRFQNIVKLLSDQNLVVIVAVLYCNPELLKWNRDNMRDYFEVYLEASLDTVRNRDVKGLYAGASSGEIANVVGVDIPWNAPESPDLIINTDNFEAPELLADRVVGAVPRLARVLEAKRVEITSRSIGAST